VETKEGESAELIIRLPHKQSD